MAGGARSYLAAFADMHTLASADERRQVARQGLAILADIAEREPASLEGVAPDALLLSVRAALNDGLLAELDTWLSPASAAIALFELAQALPAGPERRELGRRVLTRLREADRDTFVRLLIALARTSPKIVASEGLRARLEVVLAAPLTAPGMIGELAIGLLAQPSLAQSWVEQPATGSLPSRRLAARLLAHGAREALRRHDAGDRGGVRVLARPGTRAALTRLLGDREALVWRFASIARGLLAHVDSALADDIDRELRPTATNTELRRAAASAAAALERGGAANRWLPVLAERAAREPGIARGAILGLAGLAVVSPDAADELANGLVTRAPLEAAEGLADLRREEATPLLPIATAAALAWVRSQIAADPNTSDDSRWALLRALDQELRAADPDFSGAVSTAGIGSLIASARAALDIGDITTALHQGRRAVDEIAAAADWLRAATDDDPVDRRHSMRLLRELDRELLADTALYAVLALTSDTDPARAQFAGALAAIEAALLARERAAESGAVAHGGLRIARLRALIRLLDGVRITSDADLASRLAAMRQLMERAQQDHSSLRRAVWVAMTRAGDALLRDGHAELTDLLLAWTTTFHDEDFAIVREASMVPELEATFEQYALLDKATWEASDPDDAGAMRTVVERLVELADALPPEQSPRVESVRLALARLGNLLLRLALAQSQRSVPTGTFDAIANELGTLARRVYGARRRLGLDAVETSGDLEAAIRAIETARDDGGTAPSPDALDEAIAGTIDLVRDALPPALAGTIERVFVGLARRPLERTGPATSEPVDVVLPGWVPLSRLVGGFYVVRSIGRGAGGSVLLAVRAEQRSRPDRELVALKVPDYSGDAARAMSESVFEQLFREEAGALLALPKHRNLARFITFDASAQPKPILVMEFVRGTNLERALEAGDLDIKRALQIVDDLLAGIEAMHAAEIAHLDVKPPNLLLRDGSGEAVLVDFGLAGRRLRTGCGSAHYGAFEVWEAAAETREPFASDVYAAAAVAYEVLTGELLFQGDTLQQLLAHHYSPQPGAKALASLARSRELAPLADLLRAALSRDARKRPTVARLRAGFGAIERDLRKLQWPLRP